MLKQSVYGLALGYEDLDDHDALRHDPALQTFVGKETELTSSPTLCRFENSVSASDLFPGIPDKYIYVGGLKPKVS